MTRKTNVLITRYGVSSLWKNKSQYFTNILQINSLLRIGLKFKNFNILNIKYTKFSVNIVVYSQQYSGLRFKNLIYKYFKVGLSLEDTLQQFGIGTSCLSYIFRSINKKILFKKLFTTKFKVFLFSLEIKKHIIFFLFLLLKYFSTYILSYCTILSKSFIKESSVNCLSVFIKKRVSQFILVRKVNGLIKLKLISSTLSNIVYSKLRLSVTFNLQNIYLTKGWLQLPTTKGFLQNHELRHKFFTIFFSIKFFNAELLGHYLANLLLSSKNHLKIFYSVIKFVELLFFNDIIVTKGLRIRLTGKINGKMRKSKHHYSLGNSSTQSLSQLCNYSLVNSHTKYGVLSLKTWIFQSNEYNNFL